MTVFWRGFFRNLFSLSGFNFTLAIAEEKQTG